MLRIGLLLVSVATYSASADAQSKAPTPPDVIVEGRIADQFRRVCKQSTATGSIIPSRTCKTKAEWEEIRQRDLAAADQLKDDVDRYRQTQAVREAMCGEAVRC